MIVVPPTAAARLPVRKSSLVTVWPEGFSRWVCGSTPPGITIRPAASITSASGALRSRPMAAMVPSTIRMSALYASTAVTMRPFLTSVRILSSPFIVPHQARKPCERLRVDAPKRSARQRCPPMAQAGDGLGDPGGYTGDTQNPNALFDLADLLRNAGTAEQQAFSTTFDRLLSVKD